MKILVQRDNGELTELTKLPPDEVADFMSFMQEVLFTYSMLKLLHQDGKN